MLRVNQQLCDLTGYGAAELLGRTVFQETVPEDVAEDRALFTRQLIGEIDRYTIEKRIYRKGGGWFWASVASASVRDPEGRFLYAVRVQHDISDRKRAEATLSQRVAEQAALFEFSERLQHSGSAQQIYDAALDAITRGLGCERASILLFDDAGVMRFAAWRGLSEAYRRAVDGHSPWQSDEVDPHPLCIEDVARSNLPDELKETIARERIAAVAFIPVMEEDRLAGKFMAYYATAHQFSEAEVDAALTLARLLGFSLARLKGEEARRAAERDARQFAAIVESSDDAILSMNLDGLVLTWNTGAERLFGYSRDEMIDRSITLLIPPDRPDEEPLILARIRRGERIAPFETVRQRKDGRLVDIWLTTSPIRDRFGRIVGVSKIARDITERKLAEARLKDSERRLQELLAAIPAAIYTTDAAGRVTYFNQAVVELAGSAPKLGDDGFADWKLFNPDGTPLPYERSPMATALTEGRAVRGAEAVAERSDGTRLPFIPFPTPLRDAAGEIVGAVNMLVDISERKQAETQQRLLLNELNHRTKNNMQILQSLLFSAAKNAKDAEARRVLGEATGRVAAMAAAQRVLYGETDASRFSADEFMRAVTDTVRHTLPQEVSIVCETASGVLSNDAAMPLALIFNELVTNAAKHGARGAAEPTIRVGLANRGDAFELYVEDDGPGFEFDEVRSRSSGLRLVAGLARQLNGSFEVTRSPSRARLRFPMAI